MRPPSVGARPRRLRCQACSLRRGGDGAALGGLGLTIPSVGAGRGGPELTTSGGIGWARGPRHGLGRFGFGVGDGAFGCVIRARNFGGFGRCRLESRRPTSDGAESTLGTPKLGKRNMSIAVLMMLA